MELQENMIIENGKMEKTENQWFLANGTHLEMERKPENIGKTSKIIWRTIKNTQKTPNQNKRLGNCAK